MRKKELVLPMDISISGGSAGGGFPAAAVMKGGDLVTAGLQELFASIADEPIPDDFLRLLDAIDASATRLAVDSHAEVDDA